MCGGGKYCINPSARQSIQNMQDEARKKELRHLSHSHKDAIAQILDTNGNWRKLFDSIPRNVEDIGCNNRPFVRKYPNSLAEIIKNAADRQGIPVAMVLFEEWSTSGRHRATVEHLYQLLNQIPIYRASDYIAENILRIAPPDRPEYGPGRRIDISLPIVNCDTDEANAMLDGHPTPGTSGLERPSQPGENDNISKNINTLDKPNAILGTSSTSSSNSTETNATEANTESESDTNGTSVNIGALERDQGQESIDSKSSVVNPSQQNWIETPGSQLPLVLSQLPLVLSNVELSSQSGFSTTDDTTTTTERSNSSKSDSNDFTMPPFESDTSNPSNSHASDVDVDRSGGI